MITRVRLVHDRSTYHCFIEVHMKRWWRRGRWEAVELKPFGTLWFDSFEDARKFSETFIPGKLHVEPELIHI